MCVEEPKTTFFRFSDVEIILLLNALGCLRATLGDSPTAKMIRGQIDTMVQEFDEDYEEQE